MVTVGSSTTTPTDNTPDCSYCTDGCSSCQTSTDDSDDDDTDDDNSDMVTCERPGCGQSWPQGNSPPGCFAGDYPGQDCFAPALTKECMYCGQYVLVSEAGWYCDDTFTTTHAFYW